MSVLTLTKSPRHSTLTLSKSPRQSRLSLAKVPVSATRIPSSRPVRPAPLTWGQLVAAIELARRPRLNLTKSPR